MRVRTKYLTQQETAAVLGVSYQRVWQFIKDGRLDFRKHRVVSRKSVERLMRERAAERRRRR